LFSTILTKYHIAMIADRSHKSQPFCSKPRPHTKVFSAIAFVGILLLAPLLLTAQAKDQVNQVPSCKTPLKMVLIPGGTFTMGSPATEADRSSDEGPQRKVTVSAFYLSAYETTWEQYDAFFNDENFARNSDADAITRPSPMYNDYTRGMGKEGHPATSMQQYGALMFCRWLYQKTGVFYRLPTEAEWEYAARAGNNTTWISGDAPDGMADIAWFTKNSDKKYQPVGKLKPNAFGLYDIIGNVAEWVLDEYDPAYFEKIADGATDPVVKPTKRSPRSVRGGSYINDPSGLRTANRLSADASWNRRDPQMPKSKWWLTDAPFVGFRLAMPVTQPSAEEAEAFFKLHLGK
jgi:formylglycine-generating enzyme required for sulfatase activity